MSSNVSTPVTPTAANGKQNGRSAKLDGIKGGTGDTTRDKCIELVYDALASDSSARKSFPRVPLTGVSCQSTPSAVELVLSRARGVERCVYHDNGGTTAAYKQKIRSLFVNLKDKNNPSLRENVISGDVPVEKLAKMTSEVGTLILYVCCV
jgi:transcription elongation factor S-II